MRRRLAILAIVFLPAFGLAPAAYGHDVPGPNGGVGDTPFNSGNPNAGTNFDTALTNSDGAAANALFRNPTCGAHDGPGGIHPPGNP